MRVNRDVPMWRKELSGLHPGLKKEAQALARLGSELIRVGSLGFEKLLALLCNTSQA